MIVKRKKTTPGGYRMKQEYSSPEIVSKNRVSFNSVIFWSLSLLKIVILNLLLSVLIFSQSVNNTNPGNLSFYNNPLQLNSIQTSNTVSKSAPVRRFKNSNLLNYTGKTSTHIFSDILAISVIIINPALIIEDKKAYFGLTKEISAGIYPLGRVSFEYMYIFRKERTSAIRLSYNNDIPVYSMGQTGGIFISPGGGYYTDFLRKGWFVQAAAGLIGGAIAGAIRLHPNIKFRKTYVNDHPDIFDITLGIGISLYP